LLSFQGLQPEWGNGYGLPVKPNEENMRFGPFLVIAILLLLAWAGSFLMFHVASGLIHVLLVLAVLSVIFHFVTGRRVA
jgi:hypothetical protein